MESQDIFYLHMAFDEYMPENIGNQQILVMEHMVELLESQNFSDLFFSIYSPETIDTFNVIKNIYNTSLAWDSGSIDKTEFNNSADMTVIIQTGYTQHAISIILIKTSVDKFKIIIVNSGGGVQYHGVSVRNNVMTAKIFVELTLNISDIDKVLDLIYINNLRKISKTGKIDHAYFYDCIIQKIHSISDERELPFNELRGIEYYTQNSGSCTFYSTFYPIYYFLQMYGKPDKDQFRKLEYLLSLYSMHEKNSRYDLYRGQRILFVERILCE